MLFERKVYLLLFIVYFQLLRFPENFLKMTNNILLGRKTIKNTTSSLLSGAKLIFVDPENQPETPSKE